MNSEQMARTQLDAKILSLTIAGTAIRTGQLVTDDEELIDRPHDWDGDDGLGMIGSSYASSLVVEHVRDDTGITITLALGGPRVDAHRDFGFEAWMMTAYAGTFEIARPLDPQKYPEAVLALEQVATHADVVDALTELMAKPRE